MKEHKIAEIKNMNNYYNAVSWDEDAQVFVFIITDPSGNPFKIYLSEKATIQLIEDIEKDYYARHNRKPFDTNEIIYVIEYADIAGSGIEYATTRENEAIDKWRAITETHSSNPIRFTYSEYINGVRKVMYRHNS